MAVRKAPQAAASWVILRAMPRSSGAPPPDLRVRASACMPLGSRISSRPGTFLQSSASARLVSSLPRRRRSNSSGRSSGGSLSSKGSSVIPSEAPASVPPSLGMGSNMVPPSTNMNVIWPLHAPPILTRPFWAPAGLESRIDSRHGRRPGTRERQGPGELSRRVPHPRGGASVGRATHGLLRDRLRPRACQDRRGGLAEGERHRPPQLRRDRSSRTDASRVPRKVREAGDTLGRFAKRPYAKRPYADRGFGNFLGDVHRRDGSILTPLYPALGSVVRQARCLAVRRYRFHYCSGCSHPECCWSGCRRPVRCCPEGDLRVAA